jgi:hypothetical protein
MQDAERLFLERGREYDGEMTTAWRVEGNGVTHRDDTHGLLGTFDQPSKLK